ncbi:MAG: FAD-dependent oxidoreductase [Propionibacteriales bacterium]|nr:FAD-dependent oxidoreductase [Propionibacteriales bacterium]
MRILVVGAGVIGLSCAVRLARNGHDVHVLARDLPLETTSAVAAALWYPYRALPRDKVTAWGERTYAEFTRLAEQRPESGVSMVDGTELLHESAPDSWWRSAVPDLERVRTLPDGYRDGWRFRAPVVEMPRYLSWLRKQLADAGGTVTRMALAALPNHAPVVVNAAGLGGRALAGDSTLWPVRGQVVYVEQFGLDRWWLDGSGPTYVVPRSKDVVVGGTDDEGEWATLPQPDVAERILRRAARIVPDVAKARVLGHRVGLRPARPQVRLEEEPYADGRRVIHCYGHGGAGVTLSWGCADEVVRLVDGA